MTGKMWVSHPYAFVLFVSFALVAVVCGVTAIQRHVEYRSPAGGGGALQSDTTSFEAWKSRVMARLSEESRSDSTGAKKARPPIPNDTQLMEIYNALKAQERNTHSNLVLLRSLPPASACLLAIVLCVLQWRLMRGMSTRVLPALASLFFGLVSPAAASFLAQFLHSYVPGVDEDLDVALLQTMLGLPLVTAFTIPGFLGLAWYLYWNNERLPTRALWTGGLLGTGIMTALVLASHTGMYELLYARGRMHSTTGVGIVFVSFYCLVIAAVAVLMLWWIARRTDRRKNQPVPPVVTM